MRDVDELTQALRGKFAEEIVYGLFEKMRECGIPQKLLLTPGEAAWALGFTESAFNQSDWMADIPVVKVGIKNRYDVEDLKVFARNRRFDRLRPPKKPRVA